MKFFYTLTQIFSVIQLVFVTNNNQNGLLVDFFDINALTQQITDVLNHPNNYQHLREQARKTAQNYSIEKGNKAYQKLILG